jgi:hypothetical protein
MNLKPEQIARIADLEWTSYVATTATARVTPGVEVIMRDDVVINTSQAFPSPDVNHACLLRTTPQGVDSLIAETIAHFESKDIPTTIFVSPACTPANLSEHLLRRGFVEQPAKEAWLTLDLLNSEMPALPSAHMVTREILAHETLTFAEIFMAAFEMPVAFAPYLVQILEPSMHLSIIHHYMALVDEQPVGICTTLCHENICILGSAGVLPTHRKSGAATYLAIKAMTEAREQGSDTVIVQTTSGGWLERVLCANGFEKVFTRTCYILPG